MSTARSILCEEDEEQEDIDDVNAVLIKKFILRSLIGFKFLPLYIKTSPYVKHKFNYLLPSRASAAKSCVIQPLFIKSCAFNFKGPCAGRAVLLKIYKQGGAPPSDHASAF